MILNYRTWKSINEETSSVQEVYVTCDFRTPTQFKGDKLGAEEILALTMAKIVSLFPNMSYAKGHSRDHRKAISIPQDKFEDLDGNTEPLLFEIPDKPYITNSLAYPTLIINWFKDNAKENFSKQPKVIKCILKDEFLNYSKDDLINRIEKDLIDKFGIPEDQIIDEIENMMLSKSLGEIGGKVSDLNTDLVKKIGFTEIIKRSIELFKGQDLNVNIIDLDNIDSQLEKRINLLLIDYSKLSKEEFDKTMSEILNTLEYLGTSLLNFGKDATKIARKYSDLLLNHLDKYPDVLETLYELKDKR